MRHTTTKTVYAFNIFTGKSKRFIKIKDAVDETGNAYQTIALLAKARRPNYNTGWMFSYEPKRIWIKLDDLMNYEHKKPGYRDRIFACKFYRFAPKNPR